MNCAALQERGLTNRLSLDFTLTSCIPHVGGLAGNFVTLHSTQYTVDSVCSDDHGHDPVMHMAPVHRRQLPSLRLANMTSGVRGRLRKKGFSFVQHSGQELAHMSVLVPSPFF